MPNEAKLLYDALLYEDGHLRRTYRPTSRKICAQQRFCTISRSDFAKKSTVTAAPRISARRRLCWCENF